MMRSLATVLVAAFSLTTPLSAASVAAAPPSPRPRAVVLVIGDGISVELLTAARIYKHGAQGRLALERLPQSAFVRTWSANSMVTDSSSAASALARGIKAVNGRVGIPEAGKPGPESILDIARASGWSTGIVTDDSVVGGTPASFYVEEDDRKAYPRLAGKALAQLGPRLDLLIGGGSAWFRIEPGFAYAGPDSPVVAETSKALETLRAAGKVRFFDAWEAFVARAKPGADTPPVLGTFAPDTLPYIADGPRTPTLLDLTREAVLELESRGKPYFLMVEAALPDKASHMNEGLRAVNEVLEMDAVIDWLDRTLSPDSMLLATTDHGTGGLVVNGYLPLRARGNTLFIANPGNGLPIVSWATGPGGSKPGEPAQAPIKDAAEVRPGSRQIGSAFTGSAMHTGGDVWLIGRGPGSERVRGFMDNTDIFKLLQSAVTGRPPTSPDN